MSKCDQINEACSSVIITHRDSNKNYDPRTNGNALSDDCNDGFIKPIEILDFSSAR